MLDRMGTRFLQQTLNEQLGKHIKEKLPGIKTFLRKKISNIDQSLKEMGYFDESEKNILKLFYRFEASYVFIICGQLYKQPTGINYLQC